MSLMRGSDEERLDALFLAFRDCPVSEPSANFMPNLWARIDSRQNFTFSFRRLANALVTAAVAVSIALGVYMSLPRSNQSFYSQTYVEALENSSPSETMDLVGPVRLDLSDPGR
jgi:hypothetical protein